MIQPWRRDLCSARSRDRHQPNPLTGARSACVFSSPSRPHPIPRSVTLMARPNPGDPRAESWRPLMDTLKVENHLPPWQRRQRYIDEYVDGTMCVHVPPLDLFPACAVPLPAQVGGGEPLHRLGVGPHRLDGVSLGGQARTRSPGQSRCTPEPTSSTVPTASWPRILPARTSGTSPARMCRSVPQMVVASTRTMASPSSMISGSATSSHAFWPGPWYTSAYIAASDGRLAVGSSLAPRSSRGQGPKSPDANRRSCPPRGDHRLRAEAREACA
jgi:hypothetical protein